MPPDRYERGDAESNWACAFGVAAITALFYAVLIFGRLAYHDCNASFFIVAGSNFFDAAQMPAGFLISSGAGYDGQSYYRLALDPFTNQVVEYGIRLDNPPYRQQRILYPILARVLALGERSRIPWSMIALNYLAVCGLALSAAAIAQRFRMPAIYGLAIPFYPGVAMGLIRDLPDPLAISLMIFALLLLYSGRVTRAAFVLALAVLTRETMVLLAGALLIHSAWRAIRKQGPWMGSLPFTIPIAVYVAWQIWILITWRNSGLVGGHLNVYWMPLWALLQRIIQAISVLTGAAGTQFLYQQLLVGELAFLGATVLFAAIVCTNSTADPGVKLGWLIYLILAAFFSKSIWIEDWAFMRACGELMVLSFVLLIGARRRLFLGISSASAIAIWAALAIRSMKVP